MPTNLKRLYLRKVLGAPKRGLRLDLEAFALAQLEVLGQGLIVSSTAGNGHSLSFSDPRSIGVTPIDMAEMWESLIQLYDRAKGHLESDAADSDIAEEMFLLLQPVTEVHGDFTEAVRRF